MYTCTYINICICTRIFICIKVYTHIHTRAHIYDISVYVDIYIHAWKYHSYICVAHARPLLLFCSLSPPLPRCPSLDSRLSLHVCINIYPQDTNVKFLILSTNTTGAVDSVC